MPESPETSRQPDQAGQHPESGDAIRAALERQFEETRTEEKKYVPPSIPDHALLRRIGSGAYGEVWLARNALGTLRAVKIVYRARFEDDRPYEREFNGILKYEPISRTHEGLVQVLHVGRNEEAGCFYYVMELADAEEVKNEKLTIKNDAGPGADARERPQPIFNFEFFILNYRPRTLRSELARRQRLPPADAAQFALRLAGALAHLHAQGLVHRDIKPSNVIFVSGQPKLADIGLVTNVGSSFSFVGTEGFIPPEGPGTAQADIYGLGKLLYELATGRDRMDFPQLPPLTISPSDGADGERDGVRGADGEALLELNEVMTRACAPDPKQRYANATELQGDLNLFLAGRSLRRARNVERHLAQLKRFAIAACVVIAVGAVALWIAKREERRARERARTEAALRQRAETAERQTQRQLYTALLEQARSTVRSGELGQRVRTLDAVRRAAAISNTTELRREAFTALALPDLRFERELPTGLDCTMAALDPKFERVAVGRGVNAVEIRSVPDQRLLITLPPKSGDDRAEAGKWSPDGRFLAIRRWVQASTTLAYVEVWEVASGRQVVSLPPTAWSAFSFHPSQPRVLGADVGDIVSVWELEEGRKVAAFSVTGIVHQLEFSPDGRNFVVQHRIQKPWFTSLYDADSGKARSSNLTGWIDGIAWHPQDRWIAFAARTGDVILQDRETGATSVLGRHKNEARTAVFSPDGDLLFTGGEEQEIICWDLRTRQRAFIIGLRSTRLQFRADGGQCAVLTQSGVLLHSLERTVPCRELTGDLGGTIRHGAISPDGRWLAASGVARLGLWDLNRIAPPAIAFEDEFATPFFSPDSSELFAFTGNQFARWRIKAGATTASSPPELASLPVPTTKRIYSGQFTSDSLILGTTDGVLVWPRANLAADTAQHFETGAYVRGVVSPNGLWLAARMIKVMLAYRLDPWDRVRNIGVNGELLAHAFTPGSDELAVASVTGVTFLDTNRWEPQRTLTAPLDRNMQLIFTPDGRTFWLARDARYAALHDTQTFETLLPLPSGMTPLAISPDGHHLAVSVDAQRLRVWDLVAVRERLRELGLDWRNDRRP